MDLWGAVGGHGLCGPSQGCPRSGSPRWPWALAPPGVETRLAAAARWTWQGWCWHQTRWEQPLGCPWGPRNTSWTAEAPSCLRGESRRRATCQPLSWVVSTRKRPADLGMAQLVRLGRSHLLSLHDVPAGAASTRDSAARNRVSVCLGAREAGARPLRPAPFLLEPGGDAWAQGRLGAGWELGARFAWCGEYCECTFCFRGSQDNPEDYRGAPRASLSQVAFPSCGPGCGQGQRVSSVAEGTGGGVHFCRPKRRWRAQEGSQGHSLWPGEPAPSRTLQAAWPQGSQWGHLSQVSSWSLPLITLPDSAIPVETLLNMDALALIIAQIAWGVGGLHCGNPD